MAKISPAGYRFSAPVDGVQVNFCKNVRCAAFGLPETLHRVRRTPGMAPEPGDYTRVGANSTTQMKCGVCGSSNPMRSNEAVVEELLRESDLQGLLIWSTGFWLSFSRQFLGRAVSSAVAAGAGAGA